jgi:hypothetical protein
MGSAWHDELRQLSALCTRPLNSTPRACMQPTTFTTGGAIYTHTFKIDLFKISILDFGFRAQQRAV